MPRNSSTQPKPKPATPRANTRQTPDNTARPKGSDFSPSERLQYHNVEADKAYNEGKFVKALNHYQGARNAKKDLQDRANFMRANPDYVKKADR